MENKKKKHLTLKDVRIVFDPQSTDVFSSLLGDGQGNYNLFKMIIDPKEPEITQRIYANDYTNNY